MNGFDHLLVRLVVLRPLAVDMDTSFYGNSLSPSNDKVDRKVYSDGSDLLSLHLHRSKSQVAVIPTLQEISPIG